MDCRWSILFDYLYNFDGIVLNKRPWHDATTNDDNISQRCPEGNTLGVHRVLRVF
jgi:hypothetical protein